MKFTNATFIKSCTKISHFPSYNYPEFAFFGRSNSGKSSLINMLLNRKNLVKTGSKPGVTKTINFFTVNNNISIADLPGYGYAKIPLKLKKTFMPLIKNYIANRSNLKLGLLLIDIRRIPDSYEDEIISLLIKNRIPVAIVLTKCDKLSNLKREKQVKEIMQVLNLNKDNLFFTSSKTGEGKKELLKIIKEHL